MGRTAAAVTVDAPRAATGATRRDAAREIAKQTGRGVVGRPTKLTDEVQETIVDAVSLGMPMAPAAWMAGVSPVSVNDWCNRGEADLANGVDSAFARFAYAIKGAEGRSIQVHMKGVVEAQHDWQRHAWMLERRWPEWFGRRDALAVQSNAKVEVTVRYVDDWHSRDVIDVQASEQGETGGR